MAARKTKRGKNKCPKCLTLLSTADRCLNDKCENYRKKVKIAEASYKVTKTRDEAGAAQTDDDTIDAANSGEALTQAMKGDPRAGQYDKVEVEKDAGGTGRVRTKPDTVSRVKPNTEGMKGFESAEYPYNLGLPMGFKALFETLPKSLTESLTFGSRYGKLHIQVPDAETLATLVAEVEKKARGKTAVKEMAGHVANGINESVNK